MSLNHCEQRTFDYVETHAEEKRFWEQKVRALFAPGADEAAAFGRLEIELWRYLVERSAVVPSLKEAARHEGLQRTSMRGLAELLVRLWTEPRIKKKKNPGDYP